MNAWLLRMLGLLGKFFEPAAKPYWRERYRAAMAEAEGLDRYWKSQNCPHTADDWHGRAMRMRRMWALHGGEELALRRAARAAAKLSG